MTTTSAWKRLPWRSGILLLALLILFPFGWLGKRWNEFGWLLNTIFPSILAHTIGHSILFATLGGALLISYPWLSQRLGAYISIILTAGLGQETLQMLYKQRPLSFDEGYDLCVDLLASTIIFIGVWLWRRHTNITNNTPPVHRD